MPDIFVPYDTTGVTPFYREVRDMGLIYKFAFNYSDINRNVLKNISSLNDFRKYLKEDKVFEKFVDYAIKQELKPKKNELKISEKLISTQVEAFIARNFFDNDGFYPIIREVDETFDKAIAELEKN